MVGDIDASHDEDDEPPPLFVDLDIGSIRYVRRGQGDRTLLLIHGFGGDLDNWALNFEALKEIATVYALDLPGHGQSTKQMPQPPVDGLVQATLTFMDKVGIAQAHIVGHSLGGLIASLLALKAPSRLQSLMLINSAGLGPELNDAWLKQFIAAQDLDTLKPELEQLFADPRHLSPPMMDEFLRYKQRDGVTAALQSLHDDMVLDGRQRHILAKDIRSLPMPVRVIAGKRDTIIPPRQSFALRNALNVTIVPNAGHMLPMEKHRTVNETIRELITSVVSSPP